VVILVVQKVTKFSQKRVFLISKKFQDLKRLTLLLDAKMVMLPQVFVLLEQKRALLTIKFFRKFPFVVQNWGLMETL
jgi:hypothetical protein